MATADSGYVCILLHSQDSVRVYRQRRRHVVCWPQPDGRSNELGGTRSGESGMGILNNKNWGLKCFFVIIMFPASTTLMCVGAWTASSILVYRSCVLHISNCGAHGQGYVRLCDSAPSQLSAATHIFLDKCSLHRSIMGTRAHY